MNVPLILPAVKCSVSSAFAMVSSGKEILWFSSGSFLIFYSAFVILSEEPVECEDYFFVDGEILHKDLKII